MSAIAQFVTVSISRQTKSVTLPGFGVPLIVGPNSPGAVNEIRTYTTIAAVLGDFLASTPEYLMALAIFSQNPSVASVKIAKCSTPVAQITTITPTAVNSSSYSVTIDGVLYTTTSDASATAAEIVTALTTLINADAAANVVATGSTTLVLTAKNAGQAFTVVVGSRLSAVVSVANVGMASDLAVLSNDSSWYLLLTVAKDSVTVKETAKSIEAYPRLYVYRSEDATVVTSATTDLASVLKAAGYTRSAIFYHLTAAEYPDAAFAGVCLPYNPGSETWAFKTMAGITYDALTDTQKGYLDTKHANYYINVAGLSVTVNGKVSSGEYIDVMRFVDWLTANIQAAVFNAMANSPKLPLTDGGIAVVEGLVKAECEKGVKAGGLVAGSVVVTVPLASEISDADKASRSLNGVTFTAQLAGAIHFVGIAGTVTL